MLIWDCMWVGFLFSENHDSVACLPVSLFIWEWGLMWGGLMVGAAEANRLD